MNEPLVIGIGHKKGVGKDTVANRLIDKHGFIKISFADSLKEACRKIFHFNDAQLYGDLKEVIDPNWGKTPREILQTIGSEAIRNHVDLDVWIKSLKIKINHLVECNPGRQLKFVVPDVRFPNEANALKEFSDGYVWKVERDVIKNEFSNHQSEIALDNYSNWNIIINNDGTMASLYRKVDEALAMTILKENLHALNRRNTKIA
jgi:hypothetical protein